MAAQGQGAQASLQPPSACRTAVRVPLRSSCGFLAPLSATKPMSRICMTLALMSLPCAGASGASPLQRCIECLSLVPRPSSVPPVRLPHHLHCMYAVCTRYVWRRAHRNFLLMTNCPYAVCHRKGDPRRCPLTICLRDRPARCSRGELLQTPVAPVRPGQCLSHCPLPSVLAGDPICLTSWRPPFQKDCGIKRGASRKSYKAGR